MIPISSSSASGLELSGGGVSFREGISLACWLQHPSSDDSTVHLEVTHFPRGWRSCVFAIVLRPCLALLRTLVDNASH